MSTERLNSSSRVRWVREEGRRGRGSEKRFPRVRCVREGGREVRGWLKQNPKVRWVREAGKGEDDG